MENLVASETCSPRAALEAAFRRRVIVAEMATLAGRHPVPPGLE